MDMLEDIFARQRAFDDMLIARRHLPDWTPEEWTQKEAVAILCELAEVIEETNYRWWKNPQPVSRDKVVGEMVDILHFFTALCLKWGVTAQELHDLYVEKNRENFDRQYGRSQRAGYDVREGGGEGEGANVPADPATCGGKVEDASATRGEDAEAPRANPASLPGNAPCAPAPRVPHAPREDQP